MQRVDYPFRHQPRAFGAGELALLVIHRHAHVRVEQLGVRSEPLGLLAQLPVPAGAIERERRRWIDRHLRLFPGEAGRRLWIVRPVHLLALLLQERRERLLVRLVRQEPERVAQRGGIVVERSFSPCRVSGLRPFELEHLGRAGVVELVAPDAHVDLQPPVAPPAVDEDRSVLGADLLRLDAADCVAEEVGSIVSAKLQALVRPLELLRHRGELTLPWVFRIRIEGNGSNQQQVQHAAFVTRSGG